MEEKEGIGQVRKRENLFRVGWYRTWKAGKGRGDADRGGTFGEGSSSCKKKRKRILGTDAGAGFMTYALGIVKRQ